MTRMSKKSERRMQSPRKHRKPSISKTGKLKDNLPLGFKENSNALQGELAKTVFIAKVK